MNASGVQPPGEAGEEGPPLRILPIVNALLRRRWTVVLWATAFAATAAAWTLLASPTWTATARFLPTKASAVSSRITAIAGGSPSAAPEDDAGSSDYYVMLVQSPAFLARVAQRAVVADGTVPRPLTEVLGGGGGSESMDAQSRRAVAALQAQVSISVARAAVAGAPRVLTLQVVAGQPRLAADIAQAILDQIDEHNASARANRARSNREFVDAQARKAKSELDAATDAVAEFEAKNRRAEAPRIRAEQERLARQVRVLEEVYVTLTKQLELAKVEEEESRPTIEVLQRPEQPLARTSPRRSQTVVLATAVGLLWGCIWALASERMRRSDPEDPDAIEFRNHVRDLGRLLGIGRGPYPGGGTPTP